MKVKTKRDIVIPAGTEFAVGPYSTSYFEPHLEHLIALGPDSTASFRFPEAAIEENPELFEVEEGE